MFHKSRLERRNRSLSLIKKKSRGRQTRRPACCFEADCEWIFCRYYFIEIIRDTIFVRAFPVCGLRLGRTVGPGAAGNVYVAIYM